MIFETLHESAQRGELILVDGGMCHFHLRRDGQLTIHEIIVPPDFQKQGIGSMMLDMLTDFPGATCVFAKCPADLAANAWYAHRGFTCEGQEVTRTGRTLNLWRLQLDSDEEENDNAQAC